jgi:hypothetical protein
MAKYLISFPSAAMVVPEGEWEEVGHDAHAVIEEAKAAGVCVFGGGIDEDVPPVLVSADGAVTEGGYPGRPDSTAASLCSSYRRARRRLRGPRVSRRPADATCRSAARTSSRKPAARCSPATSPRDGVGITLEGHRLARVAAGLAPGSHTLKPGPRSEAARGRTHVPHEVVGQATQAA